jgi:hypothetical protein
MTRFPLVVLLIVGVRLALAQTDWLIDASPFVGEVVVSPDGREIVLDNGLIRRTLTTVPDGATIGFDNLMTGASILRGIKPEAIVEIDGNRFKVGGLLGQRDYAFLDPSWLDELEADPAALHLTGHEVGEPIERMAWAQVRHHAPEVRWPPPGKTVRMDYAPEAGAFVVSIYYQIYDGLPLICKWITVTNHGPDPITLDGFTSELLAAVEPNSFVGGDPARFETPNIYVESDYAMGGSMQSGEAITHAVRWIPDPQYQSQVHYKRQTPCLLEVSPDLGPAEVINPGETFESLRTWELVQDSTDRERQGLAIRRLYRTIAPWVTENPLMMHVRYADWDSVRQAIDQCAEVGFEMVILTFGSGFNIENDSPEYLAQMKRYADYARSKGIEIGGYSLLASRSIGPEDDVVMPEGTKPTFGHSPCIGSSWGQAYFAKLYRFYQETGFTLLEHDGSYPGDECRSTDHPGHRGHEDSRWAQWRTTSDLYKWCLARGIYLNVPDWYYLSGSTKCGMGYRETNWSLPRAQQVIHTRQNIYDGTWTKTPSMGWMFVPLTQYHGGGPAATIEPLVDHLEHYENMIVSNLAMGVQACYRGPRLFDSDKTRDLVKQWVNWFKQHRDILESDIIHGRRADGRDVDWMLHVNPDLETPGMLVAFNPLPEHASRTLRVNLYYTGLVDEAVAVYPDGLELGLKIRRDFTVEIPVEIEPNSSTWVIFRHP